MTLVLYELYRALLDAGIHRTAAEWASLGELPQEEQVMRSLMLLAQRKADLAQPQQHQDDR